MRAETRSGIDHIKYIIWHSSPFHSSFPFPKTSHPPLKWYRRPMSGETGCAFPFCRHGHTTETDAIQSPKPDLSCQTHKTNSSTLGHRGLLGTDAGPEEQGRRD